MELYKLMLRHFGKQNWWPAETQYEVIVGAILTQNTAWKNVEKAIKNLKNAGVLEPKAILALEDERLQELIRPAGFYRQKAKRLKEATQAYLSLKEDLPPEEMRAYWLSVKGIGRETADSITLYAYNKLTFVVDAYTRRFCSYYQLFQGKDYEDYLAFFQSNLPRDLEVYKEYHALIVEWGKRKRKGTLPDELKV
jgi:endonuclease-3 related protein